MELLFYRTSGFQSPISRMKIVSKKTHGHNHWGRYGTFQVNNRNSSGCSQRCIPWNDMIFKWLKWPHLFPKYPVCISFMAVALLTWQSIVENVHSATKIIIPEREETSRQSKQENEQTKSPYSKKNKLPHLTWDKQTWIPSDPQHCSVVGYAVTLSLGKEHFFAIKSKINKILSINIFWNKDIQNVGDRIPWHTLQFLPFDLNRSRGENRNKTIYQDDICLHPTRKYLLH